MKSTMDKVQCTNDDGEIFRVGDRVQVVTCDDWDTGDGDILDGEGDLYGKTGRVVRIGIPFAEVELENGEVMNFSGRCLQKADRRTFEEIVKELESRLTQYGWSLDAREAGCFRDDWGNFLTISKHDGFEIEIAADEPSVNWSFKSEELAAISSACTEIAALRKEEQQ